MIHRKESLSEAKQASNRNPSTCHGNTRPVSFKESSTSERARVEGESSIHPVSSGVTERALLFCSVEFISEN